MIASLPDLRITPKRLGQILMDSFCARCFWYLLQQRFHPTFDHFGGAIFNDLERAQMAVVGDLLQKNRELPEEFAPFCDLVDRVEYPRNWRKFKHILDSGVELYGVPDDIFNVSDGSIAIIDHKSAHPREGKDPYLPCYQTQVIGYALIAEFGLNLGCVSKAGLFYWSAQHEAVISEPGKSYHHKKLWMSFVPKPVAFDIDYALLDAPLKEAVRLWDENTPPERSDGCKDCKKLDALMAIDARIQELLEVGDQKILSSCARDPYVVNFVQQRIHNRKSVRGSALVELCDERSELNFADDGMVAMWDA
jgi:hypothetical protein